MTGYNSQATCYMLRHTCHIHLLPRTPHLQKLVMDFTIST